MSDLMDWDILKKTARDARKNAYAPYSSFRVGAAILANGQVFSGCNVENVSYPVGLCAERGALAAAVAAGCKDFQAVVVVGERVITPCGMCRQALSEFNSNVQILLVGDDDKGGSREVETDLGVLMPDPFK